MRILSLLAFWVFIAFPVVARAEDAQIPAHLLHNINSGIYIEDYLRGVLAPVRRHGDNGVSLDEGSINRFLDTSRAEVVRQELQEFLRHDMNNDGKLTEAEIRAVVLQSPRPRDDGDDDLAAWVEERVKAMLRYDGDGNGIVSYDEMSKAAAKRAEDRYYKDEADDLRALLALDPDHDGVLTARELEGLARTVFAVVDIDNDGKISAEEYRLVSEMQATARASMRHEREESEMRARMQTCTLGALPISDNLSIYAASGARGRDTDRDIDDSGERSSEMDVTVDLPGQNVALILGAINPVFWNITVTKGTTIHSVVLGGLHTQVAEGLPKGVPVIVNTGDKEGPCGYFYFTETNLKGLRELSQALYRKPVTLFVGAEKEGKIVIDANSAKPEPPRVNEEERQRNPVYAKNGGSPDFSSIMHQRNAKKILQAVEEGIIRPASNEDAEAWMDALVVRELETHAFGLPPVKEGNLRHFLPAVPIQYGNAFVVLKELVIPEGFGGYFIIPKGAPMPKGYKDNSGFYDMNSVTCSGMMADFFGSGIKCNGRWRD